VTHIEQVHIHQVVGARVGLGCGSVAVGDGGEVLASLHHVYRALPLRRGGNGNAADRTSTLTTTGTRTTGHLLTLTSLLTPPSYQHIPVLSNATDEVGQT